MHNSFILQQYVCTTILNMFRAARCSSSGGQIVSPQPLVSSLFTNSHTAQYAGGERTAVRSPPAYCTAVFEEWRYQRLWWYNLSSWRWAAFCSKHVEDRNVTHILYIFFWVFPRRQIVLGRRFGTLYQFHLQRLGVHCTLYTVHSAFEDWTDTRFRNVGQLQFDAGENTQKKI